jgi:predicted MFS family arabinose efflux permease
VSTKVTGARPLNPRIWLLAAGAFAIGTDSFVVAGLLPSIAADLAISLPAAGQVVSTYAITYSIGSPLLAALAGGVRRDRLVLVTLAGFTLANAFCALAPSFWVLLLARILAGLGAALYTPTAYVLATSIAGPTRRGAALAAVALGMTAAAVLGVPLGVMVGHALSWHATFWLVAAISGTATAALAVGGLPAPPREAAISLGKRLAPLASRPVLLAMLPQVLWGIGSFTVYTYIAVLLGAHGYTAAAIPYLLLCYGAGGLTGSQLGGRLLDRFGSDRPIIVLLSLAACNQMLLTWDTGVLTPFILFFWSFCGWSLWAPQQSLLISREPRNPGVVLALANSSVYLAQAVGATLGGVMLTHIQVVWLPLFAVTFYAGALLIFLATRK